MFNKMKLYDLIIHLGDFVSENFYNLLKENFNLVGVKGNNDYRLSELKLEEELVISGKKIILLHGHTRNTTYLDYEFPDYDLILHGHLHHPHITKRDRLTIASPGSYSFNRYVDFESFLTMEIKNNVINLDLHKVYR